MVVGRIQFPVDVGLKTSGFLLDIGWTPLPGPRGPHSSHPCGSLHRQPTFRTACFFKASRKLSLESAEMPSYKTKQNIIVGTTSHYLCHIYWLQASPGSHSLSRGGNHTSWVTGVGTTVGHINKLLGFHFYFSPLPSISFSSPKNTTSFLLCLYNSKMHSSFSHICIKIRVQPYFFNSFIDIQCVYHNMQNIPFSIHLQSCATIPII